MIHPDDAALMYDGPIPADVRAHFDLNAPRLFAGDHANAVRLIPKPGAVRARMVQVMAIYAVRGGFTEADLARHGFTPAEIETHKAQAMRDMLHGNQPLLTMEMPA